MKEIIKRLFATNAYMNAFMYKALSKKRTNEMERICQEALQDDSIADISWLRSFRKDVAEGKRTFYTTDSNYSNSHIYGIWYSLFGNLGVDPVLTPSVEHGLIFHNQIFNDIQDTARAACVTFGNFRYQIIKKYSDIPVFCVGPYIHYADPFYDEERTKEERERNGRTFLFFPAHSTNNSELSIEIENYRNYLKQKQKQYDTILVNVFWWNVNDPLVDALISDGYRIVSAGFRDDVKFMSRLKTIIQLADQVAGDSVGTHVGYCVDCGVPFSYEPLGTENRALLKKETQDLDFCSLQTNRIAEAFYQSECITEMQRELCDYYWGLNKIKTSDQLRSMAEICSDLLEESGGWTKRMRKTGIARNVEELITSEK